VAVAVAVAVVVVVVVAAAMQAAVRSFRKPLSSSPPYLPS
jgi:hypothetical protein